METVENRYIILAYKLCSIENGEKEFTEGAPVEHPFQFISGLGLTSGAFESQVKGLKKGDKFDFAIKAEKVYGKYDEEHIIDLPKNIFEIEGKFDNERIVEGAVVPLMISEGQRISEGVVEVEGDVVVMDMNHPLAGCDLNFMGEVTKNRPAINDELVGMVHMMSGGGCGGGCNGGYNRGDYGDGCCK